MESKVLRAMLVEVRMVEVSLGPLGRAQMTPTRRTLHNASRFDFRLLRPHGKLLEKYLWIKNKTVKFGLSRGP